MLSPPSDGWAGPLAPSGTRSVAEQVAGTYYYFVTCTSGSQSAYTSVTVVINPVKVVQPAPGSSHGGGGFDWISELVLLGMLGFRKYRQEYRKR
jgi:hypothetical protein